MKERERGELSIFFDPLAIEKGEDVLIVSGNRFVVSIKGIPAKRSPGSSSSESYFFVSSLEVISDSSTPMSLS